MHLYGYGDFCDRFVPGLVGLEREGNARLPRTYPGGAPVVEVVGGRGTGKTSMAGTLYDSYVHRLPLVQVDLARLPEERAAPEIPAVAQLLYQLSRDLGTQAPSFRKGLRFPRLQLGLLVAVTFRAEDPANLQETERELLKLIQDSAGPKRFHAVLTRWIELVEQSVSTLFPGMPLVAATVEIALRTLRSLIPTRNSSKEPLSWWGWKLRRNQGNDLERLVKYVLSLARQENEHGDVRQLLTDAFVADIDSNYTLLKVANKTPLPLMLLDNAHTHMGEALLLMLRDAFDSAFDEETGHSRPPVRPVVVAASLDGTAGLPNVSHVENAVRAAPDPGATGPGPGAPKWLLRLAAPPLRPTDIIDMAVTVLSPDSPLPRAVHRISGGRGGSARILTAALVERLRHTRTVRGEELLGLPAVEPPDMVDAIAPAERGEPDTVANLLLRHLVPDPAARARLPLLSVAVSVDEEAVVPVQKLQSEHYAAERVAAMKRFVQQPYWDHTPCPPDGTHRPFVPDPALRLLLQHRLLAESADARWTRIHRTARAAYVPGGAAQDPGPYAAGLGVRYLHHTMALGETEAVVHGLHARFADRVPRDWLRDLQIICSAPRPRDGFASVPPEERTALAAVCRACEASSAGAGGPQPVHGAVATLVRILGRLSRPGAEPDREDREDVERALRTLHDWSSDEDTYQRAAADWPDLLRQGTRPPCLPVRERKTP